jgi:hypothetical protein
VRTIARRQQAFESFAFQMVGRLQVNLLEHIFGIDSALQTMIQSERDHAPQPITMARQ